MPLQNKQVFWSVNEDGEYTFPAVSSTTATATANPAAKAASPNYFPTTDEDGLGGALYEGGFGNSNIKKKTKLPEYGNPAARAYDELRRTPPNEYPHQMSITFGDYKGIGHGKKMTYYFACNVSKADVIKAYKAACAKIGFAFHKEGSKKQLFAEGQSWTMTPDQLQNMMAFGVEAKGLDCECISPNDAYEFFMAMVKSQLYSFKYIEKNDNSLNDELGEVGYGLF